MYRHLLVPLDDSDLTIETVSKAVNLARALGARVSFVHVHDHRSAQPDGSDDETGYADTYRDRARALLTKAEAAARALGVPCDSVILDGALPYQAILDTARKLGCDLIFMAPHGHRAVRGAALGSQTASVLMSGELPVLVSSAQPAGQVHPMIEIIRDEHRALSAVLHAWIYLLNRDAACSAEDVDLMRAMARYVIELPLALQHPKEHGYLYVVLRGRTAVVHAELDELERQHERERAMAEALAEGVERFSQGQWVQGQLRDAVENYAQFMWEHVGRVEGVILPIAQRYLSEADWNEIFTAATRQGSPRANGEAKAAFQQLFSRMAHLAPP
ncbi:MULTISPECIES: universal stress protein [Dyella]|uniref:Universal stress protein UspA n=2 Tax=Dyella TaxID=231454 RepID=A0A4R0Z056_9GAMM|nr:MULTISPECIES: universal stress protein [Dyella]TBR39419.1 universal stress protein UspA [Dyella terrae]TCI12994.1 universal stress protein UspA [Dyella soli]